MLNEDVSYHTLVRLTRLAQSEDRALVWLEEALAERLDELAPAALEVAVDVGDPIDRVLARRSRRAVPEAGSGEP